MKGNISYISALLAILLNVSVMNAAPPDILKEYWEKHFNDPSVSIAKRLDYADSLIKYSDSKERGSLLNKKGNAAYSIGNYPRAMEAYRQLYYDGFPELSAAERLATIERMARCENYMGNYDKAVRFAKELFEADKPDSLNYLNATSYIDISQVYIRFQKANVSKDYLLKALDYMSSLKNVSPVRKKEVMKRIYIGLSGAELLLGNIDEAHKNLEKAEKLLLKSDSPVNIYIYELCYHI